MTSKLNVLTDQCRAAMPLQLAASLVDQFLQALCNHLSGMLRPAYLSKRLTRPLPTKDGGTLHTIGQAVDYMTGIGKKRELLNHWQRVAKLVLAKEDAMTVSRALELALFYDAKLDVSKIPAAS